MTALERSAADDGIVGRDAELVAIEDWLDDAHASALLIEGAAGIGKTTLVRAGIERASAAGFEVLAARPTQAEADLSFVALADVLDGVIEEVLDALPQPQRRALEAALLLGDPGTVGAVSTDPRAAAVAVLGALRTLGHSRPVLVAVDDVQWLDAPSATALAFAGRRLQAENVHFMLARRRGHGDAVTPELEAVESLTVGPLSAGALHRLVRARLDVVLARPELRRLQDLSGGNPFYALELASAYRAGTMELRRGERLPPTLDALVGHRVTTLPKETREALAAASALSHPSAKLVAPSRVLEPAVSAGVITVEDDEIRFAHPLFASAAYAALDPARRGPLHARLARLTADAEERARHLALAAQGPDGRVAAALERAAEVAAKRGALAAAGDLLAESRRLTPAQDAVDVARRQRAEARYANLAGDPDHARALLDSLLGGTPRGPARAGILAELAHVHWYGVDWRSAVGLYRSALKEAEGDARLQAKVEMELAQILNLVQEDVSEVLAHARHAAELAETFSDETVLVQALLLQAMEELLAGRGFQSVLIDRALMLAPAAADLPVVQQPSDYVAVMRALTDDFAEALDRFDAIRAEALEQGSAAPFIWTVLRMALVECLTGEWERALVHVEEGLEEAVQSGEQANEAALHAARSLIDAYLGRADSARTSAARALDLSSLLGVTAARVNATWALGLLELSFDRPAEAHARLDPLIRDRQAAGVAEPGALRYVPDDVEALVLLGRSKEAEELLAWYEERARALDRASALATSARCRGLLAAARGETDGALAALEHALGEHARVELPFERARTMLVQGSVQRRANERRAARATLEEALAEFERLGAARWAGRARAELARIGGRRRSDGDLTPSERHVAELVAEGRTNREVAAALFLTERTVETHLTHVYAKLGVRSRTELARHFKAT